ncbi:MAG: hypothetical protein Q8876_06155, partial [Bacillota bacterium]|nr:hypothetical protein [Bacillota bacterium]
NISIAIKDMKLSYVDLPEMARSLQVFESFCKNENLSNKEIDSIYPSRDEFAIVYRFLLTNNGWHFSPDMLCNRINNNQITYGKLMMIIVCMQELGLINFEMQSNLANIQMQEQKGKVDLESACYIQKMKEVLK